MCGIELSVLLPQLTPHILLLYISSLFHKMLVYLLADPLWRSWARVEEPTTIGTNITILMLSWIVTLVLYHLVCIFLPAVLSTRSLFGSFSISSHLRILILQHCLILILLLLQLKLFLESSHIYLYFLVFHLNVWIPIVSVSRRQLFLRMMFPMSVLEFALSTTQPFYLLSCQLSASFFFRGSSWQQGCDDGRFSPK